ncbi:hypothetical protein D3C72_1553940 [compost metagenome]
MIDDPVQTRCRDHVRRERVYPNVVLGEFERHRSRKADERCLAAGIDRVARRRPQALTTRNINDNAAMLGIDHHVCCGLRGSKRAYEIQVDVLAPASLRLSQEASLPGTAGIVDEDIQASERLVCLSHRRRHLNRVQHVGLDKKGAASQFEYLADDALSVADVDIGDDDICSETGQCQRGARTDAIGASGDQCRLAIEAVSRFPHACFSW